MNRTSTNKLTNTQRRRRLLFVGVMLQLQIEGIGRHKGGRSTEVYTYIHTVCVRERGDRSGNTKVLLTGVRGQNAFNWQIVLRRQK